MELGKIIAILLEGDNEKACLESKIKAWSFSVVSPEFVEMVRKGQPHALVTLAYHLILFKFLSDEWIYHDLVSHDMKVIKETVHPGWREYLTVPTMDPRNTLARVLVGCLQGV